MPLFSSPASVAGAFAALLVLTGVASASRVTVPDDVATVQAALDAHVDTVFVRAGSYAEAPTMSFDVHVAGIPGDPAFEHPVVAGLSILNDHSIRAVTLRAITFGEQVHISNTSPGSSVTFEDCRFMGGIVDVTADPPTSAMTLRRCLIVGDARLVADGFCTLDSCRVDGHLAVDGSDCRLWVDRCEFHGDGTRAAIAPAVSDLYSATVRNTLIEGFASGISIRTETGLTVENNTIRDCGYAGIHADGDGTRVTGNRVERCGANTRYGYGVWATSRYGGLILSDNVVIGCGGFGLLAAADGPGSVSGNVVTGSGMMGFLISGGVGYDRFEVTRNTSALNAGSGFVSECSPASGQYDLVGNIGFGNGGHGIEWKVPEVSTARCNDWFANTLGDVQGLPPSAGDLALDPRFCGVTTGNFQLAMDSPLVDAPGCGQVGALGVGCAAASVPPVTGFRLAAVRPSPSRGPITIEYDLSRDAAIEIDIFDVQGRLVASPARGVHGSGRHAVTWSASAGLYLVRYRYPGGEDRKRLVLVP